MKLITKNTDYAVRSLVAMARYRGVWISADLISKSEKIPYQYLRRILQKLIQSKIAVSKEGSGGGVRLIVSPSKIRILDLIGLFQGEFQLTDCMIRKKVCHNRSTCIFRKEIKRGEENLKKQFKNLTLKSLLAREGL